MSKLIALVLVGFCCMGAITATAADFTLPGLKIPVSLSAFGTAGFSISDQPYNYQRFIDNKGTFRRDSVLGTQIDIKFNNKFAITAQGKLAQATDDDKDVDATLSWAFLSWRPASDWLLRGGRIRVPLYLYSENMDVGATFDFARMPVEVYSTSPTNDFDGISINKTWNMDFGELGLSGYWGVSDSSFRSYSRDEQKARYGPVSIELRGLALELIRSDDTYRISAQDTYTTTGNGGIPVTYPFVSIAPGVGYYQVSGIPAEHRVHALVYTLGADVAVGKGFRVVGEYVYRNVRNIETGPDSMAGYLAVLKQIGAWTPYVNVATLQSMSRTRNLYNRINNNRVPGNIPDAALINASQRGGADAMMAYDQTTVALGSSCRITPTSKIKAEWARTRTGDMSSFIDAPVGGESKHKTINTFSISYSVVF